MIPRTLGQNAPAKIFAVVFETFDGEHISMHQRADRMPLEAVEEMIKFIYKEKGLKVLSVDGPMTRAEYWIRDSKMKAKYKGRIPLREIYGMNNGVLVKPKKTQRYDPLKSLRSLPGFAKISGSRF